MLVETTESDSTPRMNNRHRMPIVVIFLRLAKEILFHDFRLQVCTGTCGDVTSTRCKGVLYCVKHNEKLAIYHVRKALAKWLRNSSHEYIFI